MKYIIALWVFVTFFIQQTLWAQNTSVPLQDPNATPSVQIFTPVQAVQNVSPIIPISSTTETQPTTTIEFLQDNAALSTPSQSTIDPNVAGESFQPLVSEPLVSTSIDQRSSEWQAPVSAEEVSNRAFRGNAAAAVSGMTVSEKKKKMDQADGAGEKSSLPLQASATDQALLAAQALAWRLSFEKPVHSPQDYNIPQVGFHTSFKPKVETKKKEEKENRRRGEDRRDLLIHLEDEGEMMKKLKSLEGSHINYL